MADDTNDTEKTEEPTGRKLEEAQKKGDIVKSQEINNWFVMAGAALVLGVLASSATGSLAAALKVFLVSPHAIPMDQEHLRLIWRDVGEMVLKALAVPLLVLLFAAMVGNLIQHVPVFSAEGLKPKLSKISLKTGFERMFSPKSLMNFAKGILKLAIVSGVSFAILWPERDRLVLMMSLDVAALLPLLQTLALKMFGGVIAVMTVLAVVDYVFERHQWMKKQRMTIQEIKDEHKQMEGDPTVKAKLRQVRIERGRKRMMAAVPKATVVIANPTHFAVALLYESGQGAPVCVAKGIDAIALKIREVAEANDVPVVVNPPLARTLHASVEIDQEIQMEHYKAVAEVIGYVMRLKAKITRRTRAR